MKLEKLTSRLQVLPAGRMRDRALHAAAVGALAKLPPCFVEDAVSKARHLRVCPHLVALAWEASLQQ